MAVLMDELHKVIVSGHKMTLMMILLLDGMAEGFHKRYHNGPLFTRVSVHPI